MNESQQRIAIACPKCRKQSHHGLAGLYHDMNIRCPNCGFHMTTDESVLKQIASGAAHWGLDITGQRDE